MTIDKLSTIFRALVKIILIAGAIGGILCGVAFMGPSANAIKYPSLYGDEVSWTLSSTIATVVVWISSGFSALILYGQFALVEMVHEILQIEKDKKNFSSDAND